ncbi:leucyl aminopeptidase [Actinocrispum wychmicini]|uniref:Probable cytosol aminopeptidase n=1 Tax=Actinocrispum wychmicini TaxID=1213861 RepID=A0A4R2JJG7_9PSEU|nr:leucyl aminopeptidase [Actinocrispum wychmicini]TCO54315.1 leucyl aminopeptidase [Actinocrispum wychmicini]
MTTEWRLVPSPSTDTDAVVLPAFADALPPGLPAGPGFGGGVGEVLHLPGEPPQVLLGLGREQDLDSEAVRRAAACLAREIRRYRTCTVDLSLPPLLLRVFVEGFALGGYRFTRYKSTTPPVGPDRIDVVASVDHQSSVDSGRLLADSVLLARDLVNEPGDALTPAVFADRAGAIGLKCEVWDADRIAGERLGGLLGVSRGSPRPPRLVRLVYEPDQPVAHIALVGKGVTFDAGGLSLKPTPQMLDMKADMAGAAVVLGAMSVLAPLGCRVRVDGWLPLTENMLNADPIRIGDVLRIRDGTTVEIRNADAEGRLIMADALVLAGETAPDAIVDVATLTDAAAIALGRKFAAVMGNDEAWVGQVCAAAERAGEPVWPLPLPDIYRPQLDSAVADLVNYTSGNRHGTALLAGLFLREFVPPGIPWAHMDIQATAICDADDGEWVAGGTGFGVRTLVELLVNGQAGSGPVA